MNFIIEVGNLLFKSWELGSDSLSDDADGDTVDSRSCIVVEVVTRRLTVPVLATRDLVAVHVVLCGVAGIEQGLLHFLQDHDHEQGTETGRGTDPGTVIEIGIEGHTHHSHRPKGYDLRLVVQLFNCELDFIYVECSSTAVCRHLGKFLFV